jgi:signal transduction histidine kinase
VASGRLRQSRVTIAVVLCTFVVAAVAGYQVYYAVCAQDYANEQALRSYARFAAWTFARESDRELERGVRRALAPAGTAHGAMLPSVTVVEEGLREARSCDCVSVPEPSFIFRMDARTHVLDVYGERPPNESARARLGDSLTMHQALAGEPVITHLDTGDGPTVAYVTISAPDGTPLAAYGLGFDRAAAARAVFPVVYRHDAVLPPAPITSLPLDSALALVVVQRDGAPVFQSVARPGGPGAAISMTGAFTGLVVRAAMRPAFAQRVQVGTWTWNRSQFVLGLITVAAGLIVVSVLQLHRERQMARMRSEFVSSVSHELRTPLAQIRMFAEMLRLGWVRSDGERKRSVEIIDQEARRLTHLVENILQFSRAEHSTPRVASERLPVAPLVDEVIEGFAPLAQARSVTVRTVHEGQHEAMGDRDALRQVLLNLLDNAVKYGPPGQTITVGTGVASSGVIRIWVDDEGPGIAGRDKARIWEPFRRLDTAVQAGVTGNGIGLAVVRELARAQGGEASVEDALGGGARFVIHLQPAAPEPQATTVEQTGRSAAVAGSSHGDREPVNTA